MLTKLISVSETHFQNTKTALKNQQASIQGLKTQIGQLAKLISKQPQGSLPSNIESNPWEQLNAIAIQDEEGLVAKPRPETVVSKGKNEVGQNDPKPEMSLKEVHEPFSSNSRGPIYEELRLQIEELDKWRTHKPRTHDKPKLRQNKLNTFPNQLKVGDNVLLHAADPHIVTAKPNEEIPLTVLRMRSINSSNHHDHSMERFTTQTRPGTWVFRRPCTYHGMQHSRAIRPCENRSERVPKLTITQELETPLRKVLHDCHVLLDHDHSYHQI
ncbi:hypothetical protein GOBAR_AA26371 [Gossypium barbadense]|uniref:Uncharacterized protein n=1 Tax=Gossypium barbadense TaxID=3634 RepID=A0A2P5WT88_GOSBA|nr:hypothetical protein GOBAR_AA26371 [Gossypium barbadense]